MDANETLFNDALMKDLNVTRPSVIPTAHTLNNEGDTVNEGNIVDLGEAHNRTSC